MVRRFALALLLVPLLAGFAAAQPQFTPPRGEVLCPGLYQPVCARKDGRTRTYPNACLAEADNARVVSRYACGTVCTMIYQPVCAIGKDGQRRTHGNACVALREGARIVSKGACPS